MAYEWALVAMGGGKPPQAWNLYDTEAAALADMRRDLRETISAGEVVSGRRYNTVMTTADYRRAKRDHFLAPENNPLKPCTADAFMAALECMPPLRWHTRGGLERFMLGEFYSDTLTHQYARIGQLYCSRLVDATDEATWITGDEMAARFTQLREEASAPP